MRYFKSLIIIATVITLTSCSILSYKTKYPEPVSYVNKDKFAGTWYEIVGTPTLYNGGCSCSKGVYTHEKSNSNKFKIINSCLKTKENKWSDSSGTAKIIKNSGNAKLKVTFFWPFYESYWILYVTENYDAAIISKPDLSYSAILSKTPNISKEKLERLINIANKKGCDTKKMKIIKQNCH